MRKRFSLIALIAVFALIVAACSSGEPATTFTFDEGPEGWVADFADYPPSAGLDIFEFESSWGPMPEGLEGSGLFIQGNNRSDDLFMYWKAPIDGLEPDTSYRVEFEIEIASNVPEGLLGVGGAPGEAVWIKVGASDVEPVAELDDQGWLRMNIDIGNQSQSGTNAVIVGNLANPNLDPDTADGTIFALMELDSSENDLIARSDGDGRIWVLVGSDSGFEGLSQIYYDSIDIILIEDTP